MDEVTQFVRPLSRKLLRALNRNITRDPVRVLDVLFDVQQLNLDGGDPPQENREARGSISRIAVAIELRLWVK